MHTPKRGETKREKKQTRHFSPSKENRVNFQEFSRKIQGLEIVYTVNESARALSLSLSLNTWIPAGENKRSKACSWRKCVLMTSLVIRHADNCRRRESGGSLTVEHRLYPQLSRPLRFEARRDDSDRSFLEFRGCVVWSDERGGKVLREKTAEMEKLPLDWTSAAFWITPPFGHCDLNGGSRETRKKIFRIEDFVSHNSPHKFYKVEQYPLRRDNLNLSNVY